MKKFYKVLLAGFSFSLLLMPLTALAETEDQINLPPLEIEQFLYVSEIIYDGGHKGPIGLTITDEVLEISSLDELRVVDTRDESEVPYERIINSKDGTKLLFLSEERVSYQLYYGWILYGPDAEVPNYETDHLYTTSTTPTATLGEVTENTAYDENLDDDGFLNEEDNCPLVVNEDQADTDDDNVGDACDNAPEDPNQTQSDTDGDGIGNSADNCPEHENPDQLDKDLDGTGWVCDDVDGDRVVNSEDNCLEDSNRNQDDADEDGIGDECDDSDDRFTEKNGWILWAVVALAAGFMIGLTYRMVKK